MREAVFFVCNGLKMMSPYPRNSLPKILPQLLLIACAAILGATGPADAQSPDFEELEERLTFHPSLEQLRLDADAVREDATAAQALPDPVVSLGVNNVPIADPAFDRFLPTNRSIGVRQAIPNGGVRRARADGALGQATARDIETAYQFARLRAALIEALLEQQRLTAEIDYARARDAKYGELQGVISSEIDAGRPVVFRLAEVDVERAEVARAIVNLEGELAAVRARLVDLVGSAPATLPPVQILTLWSGDAHAFHLVRLADAGIAVANAGVEEARSEFGPDWGLSLTYQQREAGNGAMGSTFDGDDWFSAQVTFTIPLWAPQRQEPSLRAARYRKAAAQQGFHAAARRAEADWRALDAQRRAAEASLTVLQENLRALDDQIASSLTTYESGVGDYSPILDGEIAQLRFHAQIARETARRDAAIARANSLLVTP